jgi:hypothetical protein
MFRKHLLRPPVVYFTDHFCPERRGKKGIPPGSIEEMKMVKDRRISSKESRSAEDIPSI